MALNRKPVVAVTSPEYRKGSDVFASVCDFEMLPAPSGEAELAAWIREHQAFAAVVGTASYTDELYRALPSGGVIARFGVGCDGIDREAAGDAGVLCCNTPGVLDDAVAEFTVGLLLSVARRITDSGADVRAGGWPQPSGMGLRGRKLLVVGCGAIGCRVAAMAKAAFGMKIAGCGITPDNPRPDCFDEYSTDFAQVASGVCAVSLHIPDMPQNRDFMNRERLACLPPDAIVLNTARGAVLDENALYDAIASGRLAGAGLDVFKAEPYVPQDPARDLRTLSNVVMTPHLAGNTRDSCRCVADRVMQNLRCAVRGDVAHMDLVE